MKLIRGDVTKGMNLEMLRNLILGKEDFMLRPVGVLNYVDSLIFCIYWYRNGEIGQEAYLVSKDSLIYNDLKRLVGELNTVCYFLASSADIYLLTAYSDYTMLTRDEVLLLNPSVFPKSAEFKQSEL